MPGRFRASFAGLTVLIVFLAACGTRAEMAEVTRVVNAGDANTGVEATRVEKEIFVETAVAALSPTPAATTTPFSPSFVVEGDETSASMPDTAALSGTAESEPVEAQTEATLTAGEIDDNEMFEKYLAHLAGYDGPPVYAVDVSERHIISVRENTGLPVLDAHVTAFANGHRVFEGRTTTSGQLLIHPRALGLGAGTSVAVRVEKDNVVNEINFVSGQSGHHIVKLDHTDRITGTVALDVLFLIDATGSMEDEISKLKANIMQISTQIDALPTRPDVRFAMVTYRDRGDAYVTRVNDFTRTLSAFQAELDRVRARGGGDYPESLNEALHRAVWDVKWRDGEAVRLIFLLADAPPHLDYEQDFAYDEEMVEGVRRGIKIIPIASSGLDDQGEYIFRQLAQFTLGRFVFLTYDEAGQPASGPGAETEHHIEAQDYTVDMLDHLIVRLVTEELAALRDQGIRYLEG